MSGAVIRLEGEYDLSRREELRRAFDALADGPATIDLSAVTYFDSIFMQELTALHRRLSEYGLTLRGANPNILKLLRVAAFDQLFHIVE
jgi:anti-anti-sigma factor